MPKSISPRPTVGVRIPDHPVALALLQAAGPLAVTSANLSGQANTRTAQEVMAQLGGKIDLILDGGETPGGLPSTVVDMTGEAPVVLREGPISASQLHQR
jgi:L-threonylcarbamoyladenylate synthase